MGFSAWCTGLELGRNLWVVFRLAQATPSAQLCEVTGKPCTSAGWDVQPLVMGEQHRKQVGSITGQRQLWTVAAWAGAQPALGLDVAWRQLNPAAGVGVPHSPTSIHSPVPGTRTLPGDGFTPQHRAGGSVPCAGRATPAWSWINPGL